MAGKGSEEPSVMELIKEAEEMKQNLVRVGEHSRERPPEQGSIPLLSSDVEEKTEYSSLVSDAPTLISP